LSLLLSLCLFLLGSLVVPYCCDQTGWNCNVVLGSLCCFSKFGRSVVVRIFLILCGSCFPGCYVRGVCRWRTTCSMPPCCLLLRIAADGASWIPSELFVDTTILNVVYLMHLKYIRWSLLQKLFAVSIYGRLGDA
jgi:hypothetical protein